MAATTPVPEPELTVKVGDRPATGLIEETINQSINIRSIKVIRRNLKQLKYWQCIHSIK